MEDEKFQLLTNVLESMKHEDMRHSDLGHAISNVNNSFGNYMNEDQRKEIKQEFVRYKKTNKYNQKKKKELDENEQQKEMLQRFISSEQFEF